MAFEKSLQINDAETSVCNLDNTLEALSMIESPEDEGHQIYWKYILTNVISWFYSNAYHVHGIFQGMIVN